MGLKPAFKSTAVFVGRLRSLLGVRVSAVWAAFDIRPVFFFGGLAATGYGLYLQFSLGVSLIFVGLVLMAVGWLMEGRR